MTRKLLILLAASALTLSACATATPYAPAAQALGAGFSEQRIEANRYRVTFRGKGAPERISDLALRRAAELAVADGYDWFRVISRQGDLGGRGNGTSLQLGLGGGDYGYRSGVGVGVGASFDLSGGPTRSASLEVLMFRGAKPSEMDAYDARQIMQGVAP